MPSIATEKRISVDELVEIISSQSGGIKPSDLVAMLLERGISEREMREVILNALDEGKIALGHNLKIVSSSELEAA